MPCARIREASDYTHRGSVLLLVGLLFDLSEIHFMLKDYKQSEEGTRHAVQRCSET